jgi:hypothetical protein
MVAVVLDIEIEQGVTCDIAITALAEDGVTARDLSGYTGAMQVRETADSMTVLLTGVVTLTAGLVTATITDTDTGAVEWYAGVYDIEIDNGTRSERIARGKVRVTRQVTRS